MIDSYIENSFDEVLATFGKPAVCKGVSFCAKRTQNGFDGIAEIDGENSIATLRCKYTDFGRIPTKGEIIIFDTRKNIIRRARKNGAILEIEVDEI